MVLKARLTQAKSLNNEKLMEKELSQLFKKVKEKVLKALEENWSEYQLRQGHIELIKAPLHEAHKEYCEILEKYIHKEYKLGRAEATRLVKLANKDRAALKEKIDMPIQGFVKKDELFGTSPYAENELLTKSFTASESTMARIDSSINKIISDGYKEGMGIDKVANDLTRRFDQLAGWEAKRIARTEIHNSHNRAIMETYDEMGVEYTMWNSVNDGRTRGTKPSDLADHIEMNGEIIRFGDTYSNGLEYPGDTKGDISEWINCRCSNAPFVMPLGYAAPPLPYFHKEDLIQIETPNYEELLKEALENAEEHLPHEQNPFQLNQQQLNGLTKAQRTLYNTLLDKYYKLLKEDPSAIAKGETTITNKQKLGDVKLDLTKIVEAVEAVEGKGTTLKELIKGYEDLAAEIAKFDPDQLPQKYKDSFEILKSGASKAGLKFKWDIAENGSYYIYSKEIHEMLADGLLKYKKDFEELKTKAVDPFEIPQEHLQNLTAEQREMYKETMELHEKLLKEDPQNEWNGYMSVAEKLKSVENELTAMKEGAKTLYENQLDVNKVLDEFVKLKNEIDNTNLDTLKESAKEEMVKLKDSMETTMHFLQWEGGYIPSNAYHKALGSEADLTGYKNQFDAIKVKVDLKLPTDFVDILGWAENAEGSGVLVSHSEGLQFINGKPHYKGMEVSNWDAVYDFGHLYYKDIKEYNKEVLYKDLETVDYGKFKEKLTLEEQQTYKDLTDKVNEILDLQISKNATMSEIQSALAELQNVIPKLKELNAKATSEPPAKEIIKDSDLVKSDGKYLVDKSDAGFEMSGGKAYYKGLEIKDYDPIGDLGSLTVEEVNKHNNKLMEDLQKGGKDTNKKEVINLNDLQKGLDDSYYTVSSANEGFKVIDGTAYYKGLKIENYDSANDVGVLYTAKVYEHNKEVINDGMPPITSEQLSKLTAEQQTKYEDMKVELEWAANVMSSTHISESGKKIAIETAEDLLPKFKKLLDEATSEQQQPISIDTAVISEDTIGLPKAKFKLNEDTGMYEYKGAKGIEVTAEQYANEPLFINVSKEAVAEHNKQFGIESKKETISINPQEVFQVGADKLGLPKSKVELNLKTGHYEYKGLKIPKEQYESSGAIIKLDKSIVEEHNKKIQEAEGAAADNNIQKIKDKIKALEDLPKDSDGDSIVIDSDGVRYNKEKDVYTYKDVELSYYDKDMGEGYIEKDALEQAIKDLKKDLPTKEGIEVREKIINGEKFVEAEGKDWVIDTTRKYETEQDIAQSQVEPYSNSHYDAVSDWGYGGHRAISNLIYGDTEHSDWYRYQPIMQNRVNPHINKMKATFRKSLDPLTKPRERRKLEREYKKMKKEFKEMAKDIGDTHLRELEKVLLEIVEIDEAIEKTPRLLEDTCLVRYGHFYEEFCKVGETFSLEGFLSTSYDDATMRPDATSHFANKPNRWKITVLAPKGTRGIRLNSYFGALTTEREWLLQRNQKFEVVGYNLEGRRNEVTIRLIVD